MKKIIAITAFLITTFTAFSKDSLDLNSGAITDNTFQLKSDDEENAMKGKFIITAGFGLNFSKLNYTVRYESSAYFVNTGTVAMFGNVRSAPMLNLMVDYGLSESFSVGVAVGFQKTVVNWEDEYNYQKMTDNWSRLHFAVRGDYRIIAEKNLGLYTGVKIGYNKYTMTSSTFTRYDPAYIRKMDLDLSPVSIQAHFGFSYWFASVVGLNAEVGIGFGGPYVFALGATAKF